MSIVLDIIVIAALYVTLSVVVQRKIGNFARMKEIRQEMNSKMSELRKMGKDVSSEVLKAKQAEIAALTSESMKHQLKPTLMILPVSLVLFYVALPMVFGHQSVNINIFGITITSYTYLFIIVAFVLGMASTLTLSVYDRMAASRKLRQGQLQPDGTPHGK